MTEHGGDIHKSSNKGWRPIHSAASQGQTKTTKWLMNQGADVRVKTVDGNFTPLHMAASHNSRYTVKAILDQYPEAIFLQNEHGWFAIHETCNSTKISNLQK